MKDERHMERRPVHPFARGMLAGLGFTAAILGSVGLQSAVVGSSCQEKTQQKSVESQRPSIVRIMQKQSTGDPFVIKDFPEGKNVLRSDAGTYIQLEPDGSILCYSQVIPGYMRTNISDGRVRVHFKYAYDTTTTIEDVIEGSDVRRYVQQYKVDQELFRQAGMLP